MRALFFCIFFGGLGGGGKGGRGRGWGGLGGGQGRGLVGVGRWRGGKRVRGLSSESNERATSMFA
jgi:hypothetical protein